MDTEYRFVIDELPLKKGSVSEELFRKCAISKCTLPGFGIRNIFSPGAPVTMSDCFRQMKRAKLNDIAEYLLEGIDSAAVWPGLFTVRPTMTAVRKLGKDELAERMASVYIASLKEILLDQTMEDIEFLLELVNLDEPFMVGYFAGDIEQDEVESAQFELCFKYGDLMECGLLAARAVESNGGLLGYQVVTPEETASYLREKGLQILQMKSLSDIVGCYAEASANLYGVITIGDFKELIRQYEREIKKSVIADDVISFMDVQGGDASEEELALYREVRQAAAKFLVEADEKTIEKLLEIDEKSGFGGDGYFLDEHESEYSNVKDYGLCIVNSEFLDEGGEYLGRSYTPILAQQEGHTRYFPPTFAALMAYTEPSYFEPLPAAEKLIEKLSRNHRKQLLDGVRATVGFFRGEETEPVYQCGEFSENKNEAALQAAEEIVSQIQYLIRSSCGQSFLQDVVDVLEDYRVRLTGLQEANEIMSLVMEINNGSRLWVNKGNIPNVMRAKEQASRQGPVNLVFGPNMQGTKLPAEIQELLKSGEFRGKIAVDDTEVKRASEPSATVGRNDPCPCGSGRKYKNCCGRNK